MAQGGADLMTISWHDSVWLPILCRANVMDYFAHEANPFYLRNCNNEQIKMQRMNPDQMINMVGVEYILLHCQEPILYVVRKQHRHSPTQVTPLSDYYIIGGIIYQAPDMCSVLNSRMLNSIHFLSSAFKEVSGFSKYHPSKGYSWDFKDEELNKKSQGALKPGKKEEPSSFFQRQRVDELLNELTVKFPLRPHIPTQENKPQVESVKVELSAEIKTEKTDDKSSLPNGIGKPPPEKKARIGR